MTKVLAVALSLLVVASGVLGVIAYKQGGTIRRLAREVGSLRQAAETNGMALKASEDTAQALEKRMKMLTTVLTNSTAELQMTRQKLQGFEAERAQTKAESDAQRAREEDAATLKLRAACTPEVAYSTNASGVGERVRRFKTLLGAAGQSLATNVDFMLVAARRVTFWNSERRAIAFDVDELHPFVLATLGVDAGAQKELDSRQRAIWKATEATAYVAALEDKKKKEAERAEAQRQAAAEAEKQFERDLKVWALENEQAKADAAMRAADAAIMDALNPQPPLIINNQNANQNLLWRR